MKNSTASRCHDHQHINQAQRTTHDNTATTNEHTGTLCRLVQKRNSTPNFGIQRKTYTIKTIKKTMRTMKNNERKQNIADILSNIRGFKNTTSFQNQTQEIPHNTQARQDLHQQARLTGHCGRVHGLPRGALYINDEDTRPRGLSQPTATHDDALHGARSPRRRQPTQRTWEVSTQR